MKCCSSKSSSKRDQGNDLYLLSQKFRFSVQELLQYQNRFSRISKRKEMTLKQFRQSMGLLGLESTSLLADRIFICMDKSQKNKVSFEEFLEYMDVVMHGNKEEKCEQSYRLIAKYDKVITYSEFSVWLKSVWKMFNKLTGSEIKASEEKIRKSFIEIDFKNDGVIDYEEYRSSMLEEASMAQWFNFVSMGEVKEVSESTGKESFYRQRIESIENNIFMCIEILKEKKEEKNWEIEEFPIVNFDSENEIVPERGPKCMSQLEFEHAGDLDSPTFMDEDFQSEKFLNETNISSSVVLEKLEELSEKLQNLKKEEENFRSFAAQSTENSKNYGKPRNNISWGDEDWSFILYMMLGIQKAVKAASSDSSLLDFTEKTKFSLVPNQKTCKFTDFAPGIFSKIRELFQVSHKDYLKSLGVEKIMASLLQSEFSSLVGLISSGKSGSFFYFSDDGKYVLKTMSPDEFSFFTRILPDYFAHLDSQPGTLIPKFFGFHKIKYFLDGEKVEKSFVVMENLFAGGLEIHLKFDLKGSTVGRTTDPNADFSVARKDLDFNRSGLKIRIKNAEKLRLLEQLQSDCEWFQRLEIIDYSLLIGMHRVKQSSFDITKLKNVYISSDQQYLYFIGVIDVLTLYTTKKKLENLVKSPFLGSDISCVPPKQYAERFLNYLQNVIH